MVWNMGKEFSTMEMAITIKGSILMECRRDMVSIFGEMVVHIRAILSKENVMATDYGKLITIESSLIEDITQMIKKLAMGYMSGRMDGVIKETLITITETVMVNYLTLIK